MTTILVPVDLAHEESWRSALPEAVAEARLREAELHVLAVIPDFGSVLVGDQFPKNFERELLEKADSQLRELCEREIPAGLPCRTHVAQGHVAEKILEWADRVVADLIVIASHEPSSLRSLFVGSVADRIVHNAKQSVLVVRGR